MQKYELTLVLDGKATAAKKKSIQEFIEKVVKTVKGKVGKVEEWGKRDLAYKIGKSTSGEFLIFPLELDVQSLKGIFLKLKGQEDIIRYLLIRKEKSASA
ncbi:30S ribosomal protein S6 [Candidatus Woesebacteria bacterium RIFOXYD1_FULL_40_21]|uniref:Small ribosomal subunit protein bS6 n=1 Tax=Candidatus Woesebacteria bacterium RIFOXYD1_FULL_40_21 TaxID=1802549 RepID=A0A1F8DFK5_9BACT|nr:MAG: 30S ribosomal protein S6 [Candidatus Woesebacteria bacterium RIFOXYD1_FULL_40_21]